MKCWGSHPFCLAYFATIFLKPSELLPKLHFFAEHFGAFLSLPTLVTDGNSCWNVRSLFFPQANRNNIL